MAFQDIPAVCLRCSFELDLGDGHLFARRTLLRTDSGYIADIRFGKRFRSAAVIGLDLASEVQNRIAGVLQGRTSFTQDRSP